MDMRRIIIAIVTACVVSLVSYQIFFTPNFNRGTVTVGNVKYVLLLAETTQELERGLSVVSSLSPSFGMFFIFQTSAKYSFWMRDMKFPIDIIWIDDSLHVVFIKESVSPETYPDMFVPPTPALYVLEVSAGEVGKNKIKVGDSVTFTKN